MKDARRQRGLIAKSIAGICMQILLKFGREANKKFLEIYAKEGMEKAIEYKNSLMEDRNDHRTEK